MNIQKVLTELESQDLKFPREALELAIANPDIMIPELVKILARTLENYQEFLDQENYLGHIYAMYLLAQFREKSAYPLIIQLSSLPGELPDELIGDTVTEGLSRILAGVSCGDDHLIRRLAENEDVNEYVRSSALDALVTLVAAGEKSRDEVIDYFQSLFRTKLSRELSFLWSCLVSCSLDLYPGELYEDIKRSYQDDLVEPYFVSMEDVEHSMAMGKEAVLEDLKKNREYTLITDAIREMEWWACFKPPKPEPLKTKATPKPQTPVIMPASKPSQVQIKSKKIGRNEPCPCGSGKKYKKCCGRL